MILVDVLDANKNDMSYILRRVSTTLGTFLNHPVHFSALEYC